MAAPDASHVNFWNDDTVELNDKRLKKDIPKLPAIAQDFQTVKGGGMETLAYLALQIVKSRDKTVIIRAIASACSCLLSDSHNFTGSKSNAIDLTGLDVASDETASQDSVLLTNFSDSEDVMISELLDLMEADSDELGAYFGVLFLAGNKRVTNQNRTAFNERRMRSATASIIGEPKIFVPDSPYLSDEVLERVYAAFLSYSPLRANMTSRVVGQLDKPHMGPALAFVSMFLLLVDSGMSALRIIKEATLKNRWIREEFPELAPEFAAANEAQQILKRAPGHERSFLKAIHGNAFVPVNYSNIDNLTGVCKEILKRTTPSYQNYDGGKVTDSQLQRLNVRLSPTDILVESIAAE
jgi:hypothetical protein